METNITHLEKEQYATLEKYIETKKDQEHKHTYEISHRDRKNIFAAWKQLRDESSTFNTHLYFEFAFDPDKATSNINRIRGVSHYYRTFARRHGFDTYQIWSRCVPLGRHTEQCHMICFVPPEKFPLFEKFSKRWTKYAENLIVERCSYDNNIVVDGKAVNILDILLQATSAETRRKIDGVLSVDSQIVYRPRIFCSMKLSKGKLVNQWQQNISNKKEIETKQD